ncbi:hypothetical protein PHET_02382 [Paragonimus heterotremus]|uniref:Galectin domain-containing protein n=1 Tax=Paragonimus heterotremus TaxID=100268 RepID=A0A8J4SS89_9TREM|nr:hypothetical protein PHET_02382 [Paragonimus heterotremus]
MVIQSIAKLNRMHFDFPSTLQYGDDVEIRGEAGKECFSLDLLSDYLAFDPVESDRLNKADDELPIVTTQPLHIFLEIAGGWDVNANSPETSTYSHGTSARRFGFRIGEEFKCTISIRKEYFEIILNDMPLASSEHLVPVGSIHGIVIDGDSKIKDIRYGHPTAIRNYSLINKSMDLETKIIECRLTLDQLVQNDYSLDRFDDVDKCQPSDISQSVGELFWSYTDETAGEIEADMQTSHLTRARSYQLVFKQEESDHEEELNVSGDLSLIMADKFGVGLQSESQRNLLLLDDPEFSLDERDQTDLVALFYRRRHKTSRTKTGKRTSKIARKSMAKLSSKGKLKQKTLSGLSVHKEKPDAGQSSCDFRRSDSSGIADLTSVVDTGKKVSVALFDSVPLSDRATSDQLIAPYTHTQTNNEGTFHPRETVDCDTERERDTSSRVRRHTIHVLNCERERCGDDAAGVESQTIGAQRRSKRNSKRSQTIATSNPHLEKPYCGIVRQPLSSLDQLWDDVLPHVPVPYHRLPLIGHTEKSIHDCKENRVSRARSASSKENLDETGGSKGSAVSVTKNQVTQNQFAHAIKMEEQPDNRSAGELKNTGELPTSVFRVSELVCDSEMAQVECSKSVGKVQTKRDGPGNGTVSSATYISVERSSQVKSLMSDMDKQKSPSNAVKTIQHKMHQTKVSHPMLLVDYHPVDNDLVIGQDKALVIQNNTEAPIKSTPWEIPKTAGIEIILTSEEKPVTHETDQVTPVTSHKRTSRKGHGSNRLSRVVGSLLPVAVEHPHPSQCNHTGANRETCGKIKEKNGTVNPESNLLRNGSSKRSIFRSRLPRPHSELVQVSPPNIASTATEPCESISPEVVRKVTTLEVSFTCDRKTQNTMNKTPSITMHEDTTQNTSTILYNGGNVSSKFNQKAKTEHGVNQNETITTPAIATVYRVGEKEKQTARSQNQNNLKEFVQSSRKWFSKRFSSGRRGKHSITDYPPITSVPQK